MAMGGKRDLSQATILLEAAEKKGFLIQAGFKFCRRHGSRMRCRVHEAEGDGDHLAPGDLPILQTSITQPWTAVALPSALLESLVVMLRGGQF